MSDLLGIDEDKRESQASKLVKLFLGQKPLLFHDERRVPFARLTNSPRETERLRTTDFRARLSGLLWMAEEKAPGSEALGSAINVLHHLCSCGEMIPLANRLAWHEGAIWLDLADESWRAVKITRDGWAVESEAPTLFRRYAQQVALAEPVRGGDPWKFLNYLNVREEDRLLFMVYLAALFIPDIPHAVLVLYGPQGSAKTTLMMLVKDLMDPSAVGVATIPRDERELVQALDHGYLAFFDNVTYLPDWVSDAFCRATTGLGFSKRQLYSDDEDIIYRLQRPVAMNAINIPVQRPDLLDRSLLIGLDQVPEDKRRPIVEIRQMFTREQPAILGGFLDAIVKALDMPEPKLRQTYRMADFISWGYRLAEALGRRGQDFIAAYGENVTLQAEEAVRADIVTEVLFEHLEGCGQNSWEGTATGLLAALREQAERLHVSTRQHAWPKSSNALARRLRLLKDPLGRIGCSVDFIRVHGGERQISIAFRAGKVSKNIVGSSPPSPPHAPQDEPKSRSDDGDDVDDVSGTLPGDSQPWYTLTRINLSYRYIRPGERCEQCGEHPVAVELKGDVVGPKPIRRCQVCFMKLRGERA